MMAPAADRRLNERPKELLDREEVLALIGACSTNSPSGIRNAALIAVMYYSFARLQETLDLHPRDISFPKDGAPALLNIRSGKGAQQRVVPLHQDGIPYLMRWLDNRKANGINGNAPIFCQISANRQGRPIETSYVRHLMPRLAGKAGIEKRVHAHGLRYSGATNAHRAGASITDCQQWLGHKDLATTAIYLAKLAPVELARKAEGLSF
jgi:site-specific recombinase XerD